MSATPPELRDEIPDFEVDRVAGERGPLDWTGLTSIGGARGPLELLALLAVLAVVFFGTQLALVLTNTPEYVFPHPIGAVQSLFGDFGSLYAHHLWVTMREFLIGLAIGSTAGLLIAALITTRPFVERLVAPYMIVLVTTPMLAIVPFLRLKLGFGLWPITIAVALASGPMVVINAVTGFRRTDLAKIALARSYGASSYQVFRHVRFPVALPMIIVGYMVGSIFGLLTAVGGEMVAPSESGGLGQRLVYFASLLRMNQFGATILIVAALGVAIYIVFTLIAKRWASWEE